MLAQVFLSVLTLLAFIPVTVWFLGGAAERPGRQFWLLLAVAVAIPSLHATSSLFGPWDSRFSQALWLSIGTSLVIFAVCCVVLVDCWRLTPIVMPYLFILGVLALLTSGLTTQGRLALYGHEGWLAVHIGVSLLTYGLATLAAMAALAAFLQERALKRKRPTALTHALPSIADAERLQFALLGVAEIVLGAGLATGMALEYFETGQLLVLDHKTLLSFLAFLAIACLLILQRRSGLRGRQAGRLVLLAYLLLTLAYPGVKLVSDLLIA